MPYSSDDPNRFEITRVVGSYRAPLELKGTSAWLFVRQVIQVVEGHCQTLTYGYRLQGNDDPASWLIRWEYFRDPPTPDYSYPLAHVHVNGTLVNGFEAGRLHIPTRRVPLELVLWHLIAEWGVAPATPDWQTILSDSLEGFEERRTAP